MADTPKPNQHHISVDFAPDPPRKKPQSSWRSFFSIAWFVLIVLALVLIINGFALHSYQVVGNSMEPTLHENDRLLVSKIERSFSLLINEDYIPDRGDIVVFKSPINNSTQLIKRVIALPGERVKVSDGEITVFNEKNPDGFNPDNEFDIEFTYTAGQIEITVPSSHVFVVGDNRQPGASHDSRNELGAVPSKNIQGELIIRLFPITKAKFF